MITVRDIYDFIDDFAPFRTQCEFDNSGLQIGNMKNGVTGVTVCLDVTQAAVRYAAKNECELIISHHPLLFHPLRQIDSKSVAHTLCRLGISLISAHTNLDAAQGGLNDLFCDLMGLTEIRTVAEGEQTPLLRIGNTEQISAAALASQVKEVLDLPAVRFTDTPQEIDTVAVCTGAGGDFWELAAANGAQALITGEAKHHEVLAAKEAGFCLIEAGHHATENIVASKFSEMLSARFRDLRVFAYCGQDPVTYITE